jgi:putative transposase
VGYVLEDHLRTGLIADALSNAVAARDPQPGVNFHSDLSSTHPPPTPPWWKSCEVTPSIGRTGQCWDCEHLAVAAAAV